MKRLLENQQQNLYRTHNLKESRLQSIFRGLFVLGIFLSFSCQNELSPEQEKLVFRYNEHANITSLDPAFAKDQRNIWAVNQLYNQLVQLDDSLNIVPDIAKSWDLSADGLQYTFHLRDDVYFHKHAIFGKDSTRAVQADDVIYSLNRLNDPEVASPGSWIFRNVKEVSAVNESTVQIELNEAFPAFLGLMSMNYCGILPREMEKLDFQKHPIGTGPFKFKRWQPNEKLVFRKNKLYFEKDEEGNALPYLEAVAISFLPEKQSEFMQFALGNLDFMSGLDAAYKDELLTSTGTLRPQYEEKIKMEKSPYLNMEYIGITLDGDSPEVNSQRLRQALNYGFSRSDMITYLRNGIGYPANSGFIPKGLPGHAKQSFYTYDIRKAKSLVDEFRKANNGKNPVIELAATAQYLDIVEFLQREWQKIGVDVNVDIMPASTLLQKRSAGELEAFRASWIADYPDAENYLSLFYSKNFSPKGPNYTHFASEEFDSLFEQSLKLPHLEDRIVLYQKMDSIVMKESAVIPLYYDEVVRFMGKNISGLGINPQNLLNLKRVYKTD